VTTKAAIDTGAIRREALKAKMAAEDLLEWADDRDAGRPYAQTEYLASHIHDLYGATRVLFNDYAYMNPERACEE